MNKSKHTKKEGCGGGCASCTCHAAKTPPTPDVAVQELCGAIFALLGDRLSVALFHEMLKMPIDKLCSSPEGRALYLLLKYNNQDDMDKLVETHYAYRMKSTGKDRK